jgi:hypothetical protein
MKVIEGTRLGGTPIVEVVEDGQRRPLRHVVRHSPTGYEWNYAGSGPADLARSILVEVMGTDAICATCEGVGRLYWHDGEGDFEARSRFGADELEELEREAGDHVVGCFDCDHGIRAGLPYMKLKHEVVSRLPKVGFVLTAAEIEAWIEAQEREKNVRDGR